MVRVGDVLKFSAFNDVCVDCVLLFFCPGLHQVEDDGMKAAEKLGAY